MAKNTKGYILPIIITLIYEAICISGYEFMSGQNYLMFALMLLSFAGLMSNVLRGDNYIWSSEGKPIAAISGILPIVCGRINSMEYYLNGTEYLGSALALILLGTILWKYISHSENKGNTIYYAVIVILVVCIIATVVTAITFPKNEIRF